MKKISILLLISLSLNFAQSFFNMNGLGEPAYSATSQTAALGNPVALSSGNPGNFIHLSQTSLEMTLLGIGTIGQQATMTRALAGVRPATFYGAVPLPTRTRILVAVDEIFNQDFDVWSESLSDTLSRHHIQSHGGIYALSAGIAQSFLSHFCLGFYLRPHLGGVRENWSYITPEGTIATDTIAIDYSAFNARFGASLQFNPVTLALSYDLPLNLTAQRWKLIHGVITDTFRTYKIELPATVNLGAKIGPIWKINQFTLGLEMRPYDKATINNTSANYRSVFRPSFGIEYELLPDHPLRLGYSMTNWYCLNSATNQPIQEKTLHLGTGFPVPKFGSIDIGTEIRFRTSQTSSGLLRETSARLLLTLAYKETWAKRTRRWGY